MGIGPNEKVRIGIIGCGGIANGKHLPSMQEHGGFEIVAFCDLIDTPMIASIAAPKSPTSSNPTCDKWLTASSAAS